MMSGRTRAGALLAGAVIGAGIAVFAQQPDVQLAELTVPAGRLPQGCVLQPLDSELLRSRGVLENPWHPDVADVRFRRRLVAESRLPVPDGPPLSRREVAMFNDKLLQTVEAGYFALYMGPDEPEVGVYALRFAEEPHAAIWGDVRRQHRAQVRFTTSTTVAIVDAPSANAGPCFAAIRDYVGSIMQR
jgi:hypothetical protein